ncbi:MAG: peptidylprolyl isomerase [Bacteroidetes bacterium 43-93]|jgi:peptidylprolyl isomerase|nr:peptidylprolyl isomerase [Bacteroidota bacterium]MBS1780649.1 peptidylprolyl isomerase [Bacteroidota bacterium]OJX01486.1 MAG: peptidylprolyl isomerase [Bacteroidetes bacterium 43-93]
MQQVKSGDTVNVHYHGKLTDGSTFDSSEGREPLQFTVGTGQVIKGFDDALIDMTIGEKKTVQIPVDNAYGQRNEDMIMEYPKSDFPADMQPVVGLELHMSDNAGNVFPVVIADVKEDVVLLDANHPLAGQDLIFEIELVSIEG